MENYNPASLAYLGDAVFELLVREKNIREHNAKSGALHAKTIRAVNAGAQSKMADRLAGFLDADEAAVYKRGRNAAVHSMPKNASLPEYCKATGVEAVFGYLFLEGKTERISEIFGFCMETLELGYENGL